MQGKGILNLKIKDDSIEIYFYRGYGKFKKQYNESVDIPEGIIVNGYIRNIGFLVNKVRSFLIKNNIKSNKLNIMLSCSNMIMQKIQIPMVPSKDIKSMVEWQLKKHYGNEYEEYIIDYNIIEEIKNSHKRIYIVSIVLASQKNIERYYEVSKALNMNIQSICIYSVNKENENNILNIDFSKKFKKNNIKNKIVFYIAASILAFLIPQQAIHFLKVRENTLLKQIENNKYVVQNINKSIDSNKKSQEYDELYNYVLKKKRDVYLHIKEIEEFQQVGLTLNTVSVNDDNITIEGNGFDYNLICNFIKECEGKFKNSYLKYLKCSDADKNYYFTIVINKAYERK